jgi:phosphatidylglycerol:prolipoprotein diacylglycerol transferase
MNSTAWQLALTVRLNSYKLALSLAVAVALQIFLVALARRGVPLGRGLAAGAVVVASAMLFARLIFVAGHWDWFRVRRRDIWRYGQAGAGSFGGILGALVVVPPVAAGLSLSAGALMDAAAVAAMPGLAIGRVGCLINGCCPGRAVGARRTRARTATAPEGRRRLPVQLVEIPAVLLAWTGVLAVASHDPKSGLVFSVAAAAYGCVRLLSDSMRDLARPWHGLALSQVIALAFVGFGLVGVLALLLDGGVS